MKICSTLLFTASLGLAVVASATEPPKIVKTEAGGQLLVDGKPYLILGGELGNSSAGTAAQADSILPRVAKLHANTVLMPVSWDSIEPTEGNFDFSILDHWIDTARQQNLHLVFLWFGAWKNAFSNYAPLWVKQDTKRFPRAISADGLPLEILSTLSPETRRCDSRAFAALMRRIREKDAEQQTVLMVQVENEVGYLGAGRDRSPLANRLFDEPVPSQLVQALELQRNLLSPELTAQFHPQASTWRKMFGDEADEVFMAWHYATYIEAVTEAGKKEYPLPMYVNAQLPAPAERPGEYPSGAPHPYNLDVYRAAAPALDFFSPDIYWPDFEYWVRRYQFPGNPVFVPEARIETAPLNALYAYGEAKALGFSPFGIDSVQLSAKDTDPKPLIMETYEALDGLRDILPSAQQNDRTRGLVLHSNSPRPTQTVALGGYLFTATLSRSWPAKTLLAEDGAMLALEAGPDEFYVVGTGLSVTFTRDPDTDSKVGGIGSIEEVARVNGSWVTERRLNGDQSNQGRQLSMDSHHVRVYRIHLYAATRQDAEPR